MQSIKKDLAKDKFIFFRSLLNFLRITCKKTMRANQPKNEPRDVIHRYIDDTEWRRP